MLCSWPQPVASLVRDTEDTVCRASEREKSKLRPAQATVMTRGNRQEV